MWQRLTQVWVVLGLCAIVAMGAMNELLSMIQSDGNQAGGVESIGWGSPYSMDERTVSILGAWDQQRALAESLLFAYTLVDFAFILIYVPLLYIVFRKLLVPDGFISRLLTVMVVADVGENVVRYELFDMDGAATPSLLFNVLIWVSFGLTLLKFGMPLVLLLSSLERRREILTALTPTGGRLWRVLWRLRTPVLAVAIFAGVLMFEPTGQAVELIRSWSDDDGSWRFLVSFVTAIVLGAVARQMALWLVLGERKPQVPRESSRWCQVVLVLLGAAIVVAALSLGWTQFGGIGAVVGVLGLLGFFQVWRRPTNANDPAADRLERNRATDGAASPSEENRVVGGVANWLAVAPPIALAVCTIKAYTPVVFVVDADVMVYGYLVIAVLISAGLAALVCRSVPKKNFPLPATIAVSVAVAAVTWSLVFLQTNPAIDLLWDLRVTAMDVLATFLTLVVIAFVCAQALVELRQVPRGLRFLGFTRTPVALFVAITLAACSLPFFNDGSSHSARRGGRTLNEVDLMGADVKLAFEQWKRANCVDDGNHNTVKPLVLIASPGGGQRAAYWSASVLTDLFGTEPKECGPNHTPTKNPAAVFALGGASGGSLGSTAWVSQLGSTSDDWYSVFADSDFLTDPFAWMLGPDLLRSYVGFDGPDRAARLEQQWETELPSLEHDYLDGTIGLPGGHRPLLVLTGTQVENGCRLNTSATRLTEREDTDNSGATCTRQPTDGRNAPLTTDILDYTCDENGNDPRDLRRSTAALLSARFPYISASGQLYRCGQDSGNRTAIVDGGYADNTGIDAMLSLWSRLEPHVVRHNRETTGARVKPIFLLVDNHYQASAATPASGRTGELLVPPGTRSRPDTLDDLAAEQRAAAEFNGDIPGLDADCGRPSRFTTVEPEISPGLPAPLAWTLSDLSVHDLDSQRRTATNSAKLTALLSPCTM